MEFRGYQSTYATTLPPLADTPLFQRHDSFYRVMLKATAPDRRRPLPDRRRAARPAARRAARGRGRRPQRGAARTRPRRRCSAADAVGGPLDWDDLPTLRLDPPTRPPRGWSGVSIADGPNARRAGRGAASSARCRLARVRAAIEPARLDAGRATHRDDAGRRSVGVAGGVDVRARRAGAGPTRRRSPPSTPCSGRCRASWRRSWPWPWPASWPASSTSPRRCTDVCATIDANYTASGGFGLARVATAPGDIAAALAALELIGPTSGAYVAARRPGPGAGRQREAARLAGRARSPASTDVPIDPRSASRSWSTVLTAALGDVRDNGPDPNVPIAGIPAGERSSAGRSREGLPRSRAAHPRSRRTHPAGRRGQRSGRGRRRDRHRAARLRCRSPTPDEFCEACGARRDGRRRLAMPAAAAVAPQDSVPPLASPPTSTRAAPRRRVPGGGESATTAGARSVGHGRPTGAITSSSSPVARVSQRCATAVVITPATRTRWRSPTTPDACGARRVRRCDRRPTATSRRWPRPRRPATCSSAAPAPRRARPGERIGHWSVRIGPPARRERAAAAGSADRGDDENPPSCTFVAAVLDGPIVIAAGWVGDSRVYWLGDDGTADAALDRRLVGHRAGGGRDGRAGRRGRPAGPLDHPVARRRQRDRKASTSSTTTAGPPGGCWCVPTVCGTTAPTPPTWRPCVRALERDGPRAIPSPLAEALVAGPTSKAATTTSPSRWPGSTACTAGMTARPTRSDRLMADWTAEVFENEYLDDGATDVHAIVTVTCANAGQAGRRRGSGRGDHRRLFGVDEQPVDKITAAREAAAAAIDEIADGTWFAVIAGTGRAAPVYPTDRHDGSGDRPRPGCRARGGGQPHADGGTAIGNWLTWPPAVRQRAGHPAPRHPAHRRQGRGRAARASCTPWSTRSPGSFQCDCRGVGADWDVAELRGISTALLGTVDLIADPAEMAADFEDIMRAAMGRGVADAQLRMWTPQERRAPVRPSGGADDRRPDRSAGAGVAAARRLPDRIVGRRVARLPRRRPGAGQAGREPSSWSARVQLMVGGADRVPGAGAGLWSDDSALTTRINPAVAHYTGQAELAVAIQDGLAAKAAGDDVTATLKLGRAAQLAAETSQRRGHRQAAARWSTSTTRRPARSGSSATCPSSTRWRSTPARPRRRGCADGVHLPAGPHVVHRRFLRRVRGADRRGRRGRPTRTASRPTRTATGLGVGSGVPRPGPGVPELLGPEPCPTPCSARSAGTTSRPASCRPPPIRPQVPSLSMVTPLRGAAPSPGGADWVAEVWVDPGWFASQGAEGTCPRAVVRRSCPWPRHGPDRATVVEPDAWPDVECAGDWRCRTGTHS